MKSFKFKKYINIFYIYLFFFTLPASPNEVNVKYLASLCATCHESNSVSISIIPSLAGYDKKKFLDFFQESLKQKNKHTVMHQIAKGFTNEEVLLMAEFFAAQK